MSIAQTLREAHPYRLLLLATLGVVVLVQAIAMAWIAQSQVHKAQAFYAQPTVSASAKAPGAPLDAAQPARRPSDARVVTVGYAVPR